jgi:hypothetical protein
MTFNEILDRFPGPRKPNGAGGFMVLCPAHGDTKPSLSISPGNGSGPLFKCHGGCDTKAVLSAARLTWGNILPPRETSRRTVDSRVSRYEIRDQAGTLLAIHGRRDFVDGKKVWWELPDGSLKLDRPKAALPLYGVNRLPADKTSVIVTEGEKAADALLINGICAVGTVTGASSIPGDDALRPILGRTVYLWPDNDDNGRRHMERIAAALKRLGQQDLYLIEWKGAPPKGDAADLVEREAWKDEFDVMVDGARKIEVARAVDTQDPTGSISLPLFPAPPTDDAYHGIAGEFICLVEPHTEGDPVAILAQFLVMFGNMIGRGPYVAIGADRHYTNINAVIVGNTSKGRKGVGSGEANRPLSMVDPAWSMSRIKGGMSSGEGLIWEVRDAIDKQEPIKKGGRVEGHQRVVVDEGQQDKRLMVLESELASVLRVLSREGNTLSSQVRQAWDSGNLRVLTKNSPAKATDAHISIVGHITKIELLRHLDATEMANGFANRFMWVCSKRSKFLSRGGSLCDADFFPVVTKLRNATEFARQKGETAFTWDEEGGAYWDSIYPRLSSAGTEWRPQSPDGREPIVLRLSLIYALLDQSDSIRAHHVRAADALWNYCDNSVKYIFGDKTGDPIADGIMCALQKIGEKGMTRTEIRDHFRRHLSTTEVERALMGLQEQGAVRLEREQDTGGRPAERWFAVTPGQPVAEDEEE